MGLKLALAGLLAASSAVLGHPGPEDIPLLPIERSDLSHCKREFSAPDFVKRTVDAHMDEFDRLRRELGLAPTKRNRIGKRDYISVSKINHKQNITVTPNTDPATLFTQTGACILMPAVDQGPLYVQGEQVRKDITEGEKGIKMTLAIQVVDYKTCAVVPNAYVDIWSSNATGMYVGVQGYPGMGDPKDASILKGTTMRGVQPTDSHGLATFTTNFPGHYTGRATHIHAIVYLGATKQANNTITGGKAAHVGQLYFDQSLITAADKVEPYTKNKMVIQQNTGDFLFQMGANGDDPIVRYAMLSNNLADGMFAWIRFGINQQRNLAVSPAAFMTEKGGVMNPNGPIAKMFPGTYPKPPNGKFRVRSEEAVEEEQTEA